jgi:hypothetical protein
MSDSLEVRETTTGLVQCIYKEAGRLIPSRSPVCDKNPAKTKPNLPTMSASFLGRKKDC